MRLNPLPLAIAAVLLLPPAGASEDPLVAESRAAVKELGTTLKGKLIAALGEGGPVHAVGVCHEIAPSIAAELSAEKGWQIGRTALRYRNPSNAPDAWERAVLEEFEARRSAGEDPKGLEHHEVVERDGKEVFRYMKAIPTAEVCTACHGERLPPPVSEAIYRLYPDDQARGFQPGDIRGAFTLSREL
jgi:hypothetical protein